MDKPKVGTVLVMDNSEPLGRDRNVPTTEDCISREEAISRIEAIEPISPSDEYQKGIAVGFCMAKIVIRHLPPVQAKTGHWIDVMVGDMPAQACDLCRIFYPLAYTGGGHHYCPNCGAKMEEVESE